MASLIRDGVVVVQHENQSARNIEEAVEDVSDDFAKVGLWTEKEAPGRVCEPW
jgi:hypothetical protein